MNAIHESTVTRKARAAGRSRFALLVCAGLVCAGVVIVDQLTKTWVLRSVGLTQRLHVVGPLDIVRRYNTGVAFSRGEGSAITAWFVLAVIVVLLGWCVKTVQRPSTSRLYAVLLGLIAGGGIGNVVDRMFRNAGWNRGSVIDFLDVGFWPVFNVADMALSVGCVALAVLSFVAPRRLVSGSPQQNNGQLNFEGAHNATAPIESAHTEGAPIESAHTEGAPIESAPAESAPAESASTENAPIESTSLESLFDRSAEGTMSTQTDHEVRDA